MIGTSLAILSCTVLATTYPDLQTQGLSAVKSWVNNFIKEGESSFLSHGTPRYKSPSFWGDETVYSVFVDRFMNGDPTNDGLNMPPAQREGRPEIHEYRQGGDLKGITARLDYLKDLGMTTIWVSPVLKHDGSFHGYCLTNPAEVDPGFGSAETLREMVHEAHKRDIKVVLDIVVNHICDGKTRYERETWNHVQCANDLDRKSWTGEGGSSPFQGQLAFSSDFFGPLKSQFFFSRCGANSFADTSGQDPTTIYGDFVNVMFDFDTRNYDFQSIAYADIDGYRLDAAKHVTEDFIAYFSTNIRDYAKSLGKDNFYIIGEVAASTPWQGRRVGTMFSNPLNPDDHGKGETAVPVTLTNRMKDLKSTYLSHPVSKYPGMNAVYNFQLSGTARDVFLGQKSSGTLSEWINGPGYETINAQVDIRLSWQLLEIHDWPRFLYNRNDWWVFTTAQSFMFTMFGQPIVYYGSEMGFNGACRLRGNNVNTSSTGYCFNSWSDVTSRQAMFVNAGFKLGSSVPELDSLAYLGKPTSPSIQDTLQYDWKKDPFLKTKDNVMYFVTRRLAHIRKSCAPLRQGRTVIRRLDDSRNGMMIFSRITSRSEMVVMINPSDNKQQIKFVTLDGPANKVGKLYRSLYNPQITGRVINGLTGTELLFDIPLTIDSWNNEIFAPEDQVGSFDKELGTALCK